MILAWASPFNNDIASKQKDDCYFKYVVSYSFLWPFQIILLEHYLD